MRQGNCFITFSTETAKKFQELGITCVKVSDENKARKRGWYFFVDEVKEKNREYYDHAVGKKKTNKPKPKKKKIVKPRKDNFRKKVEVRKVMPVEFVRIPKQKLPSAQFEQLELPSDQIDTMGINKEKTT